MLASTINQPILLARRPFAGLPLSPGPSGLGGVSIYRTVDLGGGDPPSIAYRHLRFTRSGGQSLLRSHRRKTEAELLVGQPLTAAELAVVNGAAYRVNVRAWRDDVEHPSTYDERVLVIDNGEAVPQLIGSGYVLKVTKRQAGGMRLTCVWSSPAIAPPDTITLIRVSGPTSVENIELPYSASRRVYTYNVASLQDAGVYVFRVVATKGIYTIAAASTFGSITSDVTFTADASGPGPVSTLTIREV